MSEVFYGKMGPKPDSFPCAWCGQPRDWEEGRVLGLAGGRKWYQSWKGHDECSKKEDEKREQELDLRLEKESLLSRLEASGMPLDLISSKTFENFDITDGNRRAFEIIDSWKPADKWGVMLQGTAGTGKSHLMLAFANRWIHERHFVFFRSLSDVFDELRAGYSDGQYMGTMKRLKEMKILILDDLGAEKPSEWIEEKLFQLLDYRVNNSLPTFFTTNCRTNDLKDRLHERITSRIKDLAVIVTVAGDDRRNKKYEDRLIEIEKRLKAKKESANA